MANFDSIDAFNFDAMTKAVGQDPFAKQTNKFAKDERFYTLEKDKDGNGAALIRFLPDSEMGRIVELYRIGTTIAKTGQKKRFVNEFTPASIGKPCPFQEEWSRLYNSGDTEGAKLFRRNKRYISNIKVIADPANPKNNGKVFLFEYSGAMHTKIQNALQPSDQDKALGKTAKELFNPIKGNSFRLVAQKGSNGQINYDASEVVPEETAVYSTVEEAVADIQANTYKLSDLLKPEAFMPYDELVKKFKWVTWADGSDAAVTAVPEASVEVAPAATVIPEVAPAAAVATPVETPVVTPAPSAAQTKSVEDLLAQMQING